MNKSLLAHYRCPSEFIKFEVEDQLPAEAGYFSLGADVLCYGRCSPAAFDQENDQGKIDGVPRVSEDRCVHGSAVRLPFQPDEVLENFRYERYVEGSEKDNSILSSRTLQSAYYMVRPLLGIPVRKHLQKIFHRSWKQKTFPEWPVDTSVERFSESLLALSMKTRGIDRIPFIWFWPDGSDSCGILTHDIETEQGAKDVPNLMDVDESFGMLASFQAIPRGPYELLELSSKIRGRGFEFNLHDLLHDGNLFAERTAFERDAQEINQFAAQYKARGFRAGRMFRNQDWYKALDVSYDMSIPNIAHLDPQRGGCCTVFPYFIGRVLELPLTTTQDYTLFHILGQYSIDLWKEQIGLIMKKHGLVSFIVHPDYILEKRALAVYKSLLGYLAELRKAGQIWMARPGDVDHWWRERSQMQLSHQNGKWRVEGPGSGRARVAYATLVDDAIHYEVEHCHA